MKTHPILTFGAALSAGAFLMLGLRAPEPARSQPESARSQGVPAPYFREGAAAPAIPPALARRRQEQLRNFLEAHNVKNAKVQNSLNLYFGELQRARAEVMEANRALLRILRTPSNSQTASKPARDEQVQEAVKTYQEAVSKYGVARAKGEKELAKSLGEEWTPRLRALLAGMGALGEVSPVTSIWGAYAVDPASQTAANQGEKPDALATDPEDIKKIQEANAEACCGGQSQNSTTAKANGSRSIASRGVTPPRGATHVAN